MPLYKIIVSFPNEEEDIDLVINALKRTMRRESRHSFKTLKTERGFEVFPERGWCGEIKAALENGSVSDCPLKIKIVRIEEEVSA